MRTGRLRAAALMASMALMVSGTALAHEPEAGGSLLADDALNSAKETHRHDRQHGGDDGHLPPLQTNVDLIGFSDLFAGAEEPGRIADVSAKGNYAYLTLFYEPVCDKGGVQVVDISDPAHPKAGPVIPSHQGTFSGEGSQVITLDTPFFKGDLLIYQNEICPGFENGIGGVSLVDVTNPLKPKKLAEGAGDFLNKGTSQRRANEVHSAFGWTNTETGRAYVIMTDDEEETDTDILDITNPRRPVLVAEYDFSSQSEQTGPTRPHGDAVFIHDEIVKKIDGRYIGLLSYWDGGYIQVDLTDPTNAVYLGDTDYPAVDPVLLGRTGVALTPEGNGHQAEFTRDNGFFIATDEDFDPYRVVATITDGPFAGTEFTAAQGSDVPQIGPDLSLAGDTRGVGLACDAGSIPPADATHTIAVIERGVCDFTVKVQLVEAAGYSGAIVFNRTGVDGCEALISMLVEAGIPAVFVSRTDGFRILGASLDGYTCSEDGTGTAAPAAGVDGSTVDITALFDGWGYVHLYNATTFADVDQYAIPEAHDPAYASGFGDLSVHEVATDPDEDLAYISYYAGGFRVLTYSQLGLTEVGAFNAGQGMTTTSGTPVTQDGNNFWGVEVHQHPNGQKYILASDRDSGVWIFQYTGP